MHRPTKSLPTINFKVLKNCNSIWYTTCNRITRTSIW